MEAPMDFKPGDRLGDRYVLSPKLGSGGFGDVWTARENGCRNAGDQKVDLAPDELRRTVQVRQLGAEC